jgi:hypothetical protein
MNSFAALRRLAVATSLSTAALLAAETPAPLRAEFIDPAAPAVADLRQTGEAAVAAVGKQLVTALNAALATGGPAAAVAFCQTQALPLTTSPRPDHPRVLAVKRTSLRLRNPANAPDAAERLALDHVEKLIAAGQPPPPVLVQRIETSGPATPEWRVYRPIVIKAECLVCHGDSATQPPELRTALQTRYPADAATGYAADQWRGLFRVTLSPAPAPAATP